MSLEASVGVVNGAETLAIRLVWHPMLFKRSPQWMSFVCRILLDSMNNNEDGLRLDAHVSIASCLPRRAFANFRCTVATRASSPPSQHSLVSQSNLATFTAPRILIRWCSLEKSPPVISVLPHIGSSDDSTLALSLALSCIVSTPFLTRNGLCCLVWPRPIFSSI